MKKVTVKTLRQLKKNGEKIAVLTAYDYPMAKILDAVGVEAILVGDSAGNVFYGYRTTLPVTMEQMLSHTRAVANAARRALVIADMPFMSYHVSVEQAVTNAGRFLKEAGAEAVKLEGGTERIATVKYLVDCGIPVMGHIGLTPQSFHIFGRAMTRGRSKRVRDYLLESSLALQEAGCFAIVLEMVVAEVAAEISRQLRIPTIGIGSGPDCDGQVLVLYDMLGLFDEFELSFVRKYADLKQTISDAVSGYIDDVKNKRFPDEKETIG